MSNAAQRDDFDPYRVWLGIPKSEQPPNHYRLLGIVTFEEDPQVILEGADRQVAHLKTKQSGQRVAISQLLLQQVAAAAGCLLDAETKAAYDEQLRQDLKASEPAPVEAKTVSSPAPAPPPPQPVYQPSSYPQPGYPTPVPHYPPAPVNFSPVYPQPAPVAARPNPPPPLRPIPLPVQPTEPAAEEEEDLSPVAPAFQSVAVRSTRAKGTSGDMTMLVVGSGAVAVLLVAVLAVLSRPEVSDSLFGSKPSPVIARQGTKPKTPSKPSPANPPDPTPATAPDPTATNPPTTSATQPANPTESTAEEPDKTPPPNPPDTTTSPPTPPPTSVPEPMPPLVNPAPLNPVPVNPPATSPPMNPLAGPSAPATPSGEKTVVRKLWRYSGGFIELGSDGVWKELAPTGDYYTLTLLSPSPAPDAAAGQVLDFERTSGGRLRVHDNRLELLTPGLQDNFSEVAKGSWGLPADEIELESPQQAMLQRACQLYADALSKAKRKLLAQLDEAMSASRKRVGKAEELLALVELLSVEKERFETTGLVPWSAPMREHTLKYLMEVNQARGPSEALFDRVITHFTTRKDQETASSVLALKHKTLTPLVIAKLTKTDTPRTPRPFGGFGRRRDEADLPDDDGSFRDDPRTGSLRLWSNGTLNNANGKSSWNVTNANLTLQFVRPAYTIRDTIVIGERGDDLAGKSVFTNTFSLNFTGRFESSLEPQERRPEVKFTPPAKDDASEKPASAAEATP